MRAECEWRKPAISGWKPIPRRALTVPKTVVFRLVSRPTLFGTEVNELSSATAAPLFNLLDILVNVYKLNQSSETWREGL